MYQKHISSLSEDDTRSLAEKVASVAEKGDVFALYGTLGAGKSTFSRYFIQYLTQAKEIPSPTFTLLQTYDAEKFEIYHYDMYRLKQPDEAYELDIEEAFYNGVSLIEWPEKIAPLLPRKLWKISIETKGNERIFTIEASDENKFRKLEEVLSD